VVFGRAGRGSEHGFAGGGVLAEVVRLGGAVRQVTFEQVVGERRSAKSPVSGQITWLISPIIAL
jgi:hypothetical protein